MSPLRRPSAFGAALAALLALPSAAASAQATGFAFALTQCGAREPLFRSGLEPAELPGVRPSGGGLDPTLSSGLIEVNVPDTGRLQRAYLSLPAPQGNPRALPLLLVLHGAAGSPAAADLAAQSLRSLWADAANALGAAVLAPVASGNSGGWVPAVDGPAIACLLAELERRHDIDRSRRYLWGFSAGAHYGHALALGNRERLAAYAVKAGALAALVCSPYSGAVACGNTLAPPGRRIPVQLRTGSADPLHPHVLADRQSFEQAGWLAGSTLDPSPASGGHQANAEDAATAAAWFQAFSLP